VQLVADLPITFREAIVLREVNELSYREIAEVVGVPVGTVMSRLARALHAAQGLDCRGQTTDMSCAEIHILLRALLDAELDAGHAREVEAPDCQSQPAPSLLRPRRHSRSTTRPECGSHQKDCASGRARLARIR
jgi:hypothetical protein